MDSFKKLSTLIDQVNESAKLDANSISFLHIQIQYMVKNLQMCTEKFETWRTFTPTAANSEKFTRYRLQTMDQVRIIVEQHNVFLKKLQDAVDSNTQISKDFYSRTENLETMTETQADTTTYKELWGNDSFIWNFVIIYLLEEEWNNMRLNDKLIDCIRGMDELIEDECTQVQPATA